MIRILTGLTRYQCGTAVAFAFPSSYFVMKMKMWMEMSSSLDWPIHLLGLNYSKNFDPIFLDREYWAC